MSRLRRAYRHHRPVVLGMAVVIAAFVVGGVAASSELAVPYAVIVLAGGLLVAWVAPEGGYSQVAVAGLCLWAIGHLAGGIVQLDGDRILYNGLLPGRIHVDNVVHFCAFGTSGLVWWEATRPWLRAEPSRRLGVAVAVWLAGMGVGAVNEVIEFAATHVLADTEVGGYENTGRDLVANLLGAAVAGGIAARRLGRSEDPAVSSSGPAAG